MFGKSHQSLVILTGAGTVAFHLEPSEGARLFAEHRYGRASEIVPAFVAELLAAP